MPKLARAHHFVPAFLLANFTPSGTRDAPLWTTDLQRNKQWQSTPDGVGHRNDFYQVLVRGLPADAVENHLAKIEATTAPLIKWIVENRQLPTQSELRDLLLLFISFLAVRVPSERTRAAKKMSTPDQNSLVAVMLTSAPLVLKQIRELTFSLLVSTSGSFVCTDHPVVMPFEETVDQFRPGEGELICPLSRHVVLHGLYGQHDRPLERQ